MLKKVLNSIILLLMILGIVMVGLFVLEEKDILDLPFLLKKEQRADLIKKIESVNEPTKKNKKENTADRKNRDYDKYVFVGDSRFVGISKYSISDKDLFIAKVGEGYSYLIEQMSNIKYYCDENTALIIGLGVNDSHSNGEKYIQTINDMAETMDCQIYFTTVNPVDEVKAGYSGYNISAQVIDEFNENAYEQLSDKIVYVDTNKYLRESGYETQDGLHYTEEISEKLYHYIKSCVGSDEGTQIDE